MKISHLDHLVITVTDIDRSCRFYQDILGLKKVVFENGRTALQLGSQKINLHQAGAEIAPHAAHPLPGSADLCLVLTSPPEEAIDRLRHHGITIELGPVEKTGARGTIRSIYLRDPDGNLIELGCYS